MTDTTQIAANDIIAIVTQKPEITLLEPERFNAFLVALRGDIDSLADADMGKAKDRDRVRSVAAGIARHKAAINKARLSLTEGWRKQTKDVNARGSDIDDKLSTLGDKVREPLTAWEDAEKRRVETCRSVIDAIHAAARIEFGEHSSTLCARRNKIAEHVIDVETFQDMHEEATAEQIAVVAALDDAIDKALVAEKDAAELIELRAKQAQREKDDAERDRLQKEKEEEAAKAEQAKRDEEARKERRRLADIEHAKGMMEYIVEVGRGFIGGRSYPYPILLRELEEKIVIDATFGDLEAPAKALLASTLEATQKAFDEHIEAANREAEQRARDDAQREIDRKADEQRREREKREANKRHRNKFITEAGDAIAANLNGQLGLADARLIAAAIAEGKIPHVVMEF